MIDHQGRR